MKKYRLIRKWRAVYIERCKYGSGASIRKPTLATKKGVEHLAYADCTGSTHLLGSGKEIADKIRKAVKFELALTVSVGVSFNKIFAKLGSDMKKPDAVTVIPKNSFREIIWNLPASDMLGVGHATERKLSSIGVHTIGDLARLPCDILKHKFGVYGSMLWQFANGLDHSSVTVRQVEALDKSAGHGMTALQDLENEAEVWPFMLELSQEIGHRLKTFHKKAAGVAIYIRDNQLLTQQWQCPLQVPTQSPSQIAKTAFRLFQQRYIWRQPIRSITIRAIDLVSTDISYQMSFFDNPEKLSIAEAMDDAVEEIRRRFGVNAIRNAVLLNNSKFPSHDNPKIIMPNGLAT